jgi:HEAT repeat protein
MGKKKAIRHFKIDPEILKNYSDKYVKMGSFAVEFLIERLKDKNSDVRRNVAWALGEIGDARAVDALIKALKDEDSDVRKSVAWALGEIGWKPGNDEERVLYYIANGDWDECVKMGSFAVEFLIERLKDKNSDVRRNVAWALGEIGDARAVDALIKALKDEDSDVRKSVAWALGEIGWKPGNDEERVLYYIANGDWDECVKMGSFAVEFLIERLKDKNSDVRRNVAWALGEIGDARAVDALIKALKDRVIRIRVAEALGKIGDSRAVDALIEALRDWDEDVRKSVVWALGEIGDARAVDALIEALRDWDEDVRKSVVWALGEIGDARAVDALIKALKDRVIRIRVAEALGKIGDSRQWMH